MKVRKFVGICIATGLFLVFSTAAWASSPKIGYFDFPTVIMKSRWGQQVQSDLKREAEKVKADMDRKVSEFKGLREDFEKQSAMLDEAARTRKARDLVEKQQEGEKLYMESNAKLSQLESELIRPLSDKIVDIVRKIGKDEKYDYIIEVDKGGIAWATEKDDLTKRIIDQLDKETAKKK